MADDSLERFINEVIFPGSPPRGLQFTLGETPDTVAVDTIVMANLGYFQLKANPGVWYLNLREGKSRDIYQISSHEHTDSAGDDVIILMDSFKSKIIIVKVRFGFVRERNFLLFPLLIKYKTRKVVKDFYGNPGQFSGFNAAAVLLASNKPQILA